MLLSIGHYLNLFDTFVVPSFRRNLDFVPCLEYFGYECSLGLGNNQFRLSINSNIVRTGTLMVYDNLYLLDTIVSYNETLNVESHGTKHKINSTKSRTLWHTRIDRISKNRVGRLVS